MKLEGIMLSELRQMEKYTDFTYMWNLKNPNLQEQRMYWQLPEMRGSGEGEMGWFKDTNFQL